jgi:hypothetical protein
MTDLPILQAAPSFELRRETVPAPELGGSVIVRGLMASEAFALSALRSQALKRVRDLRHAHEKRVDELRTKHDDMCTGLPPGAQAPAFDPPEFDAPALTFDELRLYGRHGSELLARAVVNPAGLELYSADEWERASQHHPQLVARLQLVAERLSGMHASEVEKKMPPTPS